ncbi:MAG: cytochrome c biogenesis protein CcsA [Nitrosomonadales bacterium]|nr:cytochrome c biogenesis protein CcsA [Nitrosomonadales bacterium]
MSNLPLSLFTFLAYGVLAAYFWRAQTTGSAEALSRSAVGYAVLLPLTLQAYLLYMHLFTGGGMNMGFMYVVSLILWLTMLVYWVARFFYPIASLQTLVLPLAAVGVLLPALFPAEHPMSGNPSFALDAHIMAAMLVYSLLTIAAMQATLMSLVEKRLHHATLPRVLQALPPLLTMETLLFRILGAGFIVLTLTLGSGIVFSEEVFGKPWQFNHKMLFGFISWFVFAVLLAGHHFYGWRGRKAVHWTMGGYIFLLLAYLGSKFVLEVLLHR